MGMDVLFYHAWINFMKMRIESKMILVKIQYRF